MNNISKKNVESVLPLACVSNINIGPLNNLSSQSLLGVPIFLGCLTIDSKEICSDPILISFSGELNITLFSSANIRLQLRKQCDNSPPRIIATYNLGSTVNFPNIESFSYQLCDNECSDCSCDIIYTLELVVNSLPATSSISINNLSMVIRSLLNNCDISSKCVTPSFVPRITNIPGTLAFHPIEIGSIEVDTSNFKKAKILLTFSGEIFDQRNLGIPGFTQQIFRVMKTCNGFSEQISGTLGGGSLDLRTTESFSYQICDTNTCDCCGIIKYTVELLPGIIEDYSNITVDNLAISAFVSETTSSTFNCSKGNTVSISTFGSRSQLEAPPFDIGSVSIKTDCLDANKAVLTFSGDIIALTFLIPSQVQSYFRIIRSCNGNSKVLPERFTALSSQFNIPESGTSRSEGFSYMLCDDISDCCCSEITYTVQLIQSMPVALLLIIGVSNVVLSVFPKEC